MKLGSNVDLSGQRFGRLVVLRFHGVSNSGKRVWECACDCGGKSLVTTGAMRSGSTSSCGCLCLEINSKRMSTHGASKSATYKIWSGIRARCNTPSASPWKYYGGRGIGICKRWDRFENFLSDMGVRPSKLHSIERIKNNQDYSPENCKWATILEQSNNRRDNHFLIFKGKRQSISQWAREIGMEVDTLKARIGKLKWPTERALTTPLLRQGI